MVVHKVAVSQTVFHPVYFFSLVPSVLWHCWLGGRKGIRPVKTELWGAGVVVCLERDADLHMAQLMPLPLTVSCFSKSTLVLPFWCRLTWVVPEKGLVNGCLCVLFLISCCQKWPKWSQKPMLHIWPRSFYVVWTNSVDRGPFTLFIHWIVTTTATSFLLTISPFNVLQLW